jgi:hypothetical protein
MLVDYSFEYRKLLLGDPPRVTWQGSTEVLYTGAGKIWDDTGEMIDISDDSAAQIYPVINYSIDLAVSEIPVDTLTSLLGHVNNDAFQGADAGTMLFLDFNAEARYSYEDVQWYYQVTLNFYWRMRSHNEVYRPPIQDRDKKGALLFYQDKDAAAPNYTADSALASRPIYKAESADGVWTTTTPANYPEGDFSWLLL